MKTSTRLTMAAAAIALGILATPPAPAHAGTFAHDDAGHAMGKYNRWARLAKTPAPDADVTVHEHAQAPIEICGGDPETTACTIPDGTGRFTIEIQVREPRITRLDYWHELGHVFDRTAMSDAQRQRFQAIRGEVGTWRGGPYAIRSEESFARTFAACAMIGPVLRWDSIADMDVDYVATRQQHAAACALIRRAAS